VVVWPFSSVEREKMIWPLGFSCGVAGVVCAAAANAVKQMAVTTAKAAALNGLGLTGCGKTPLEWYGASGHNFSRAVSCLKSMWALQAAEKRAVLKGHGFSRAAR
jgi:hypothetical protein